MSKVLIGHASIGETNKTKNNTAGDQTGKEVCTREWYDKGWNLVLRPINSTIAELSAKACEQACKNDKIGYDQNQRNTLHTQAKKVGYKLDKINVACEADCSSLMTVCAIAGGVTELEYSDNAPTTSSMKSKFSKTKKYTVLTDKKYLTNADYLKRGDILVKEGSHTVMVLGNGDKMQTEYYPKYTGYTVSIVSALKAVGEKDTSLEHRKKIAIANNILGYSGTSSQNTQLLSYLKKGTLIKA